MQVSILAAVKKSGRNAALFCFLLPWLLLCSTQAHAEDEPVLVANLQARALSLGLDRDPTWLALLHVTDSYTNIPDPDFVLSLPHFSSRNELMATIALLFGEKPEAQCRFPARYTWLAKQLGLPAQSTAHCAELTEFLERAPADQISLVFASENLAQPSSIMGHVFLKLAGVNRQQQSVEHAISFYTDAGTINLPKLFYDSLVVGKPGFFTLSPYAEKRDYYLDTEQRNLWEYTLKLAPDQRELMQLHLFELKHAKLVYFFQRYNCATVIQFVLSIAVPLPRGEDGPWTTPKDVIKQAGRAGLIAATSARMSPRWLVRTLGELVSSEQRQLIQTSAAKNEVPADLLRAPDQQRYIALELADAYSRYRYQQGQATLAERVEYGEAMSRLRQNQYREFQLESLAETDPVRTPPDSQIEAGLVDTGQGRAVRVSFVPASHSLADDNRNYSSESELLLSELSVLKPLGHEPARMERFTLYSVRAITPYEPLTGGISGTFRIGTEPAFDPQLNQKTVTYLQGGIGISKRWGRDLDVYALLGAGIGFYGGAYGYLAPEAGVIVREIFNMKTTASIQAFSNQLRADRPYYQAQLKQSWYLRPDLTLQLEWQRRFNQNRQQHQVALSAKHLF